MPSRMPRPICWQNASTPVPSGLVSTSTSPARGVLQRRGHRRINQPGDRKAELDLVVLDAVPADERHAGLVENLHRAGQHFDT